jgi:hypothetical protein
MWLILTELFNIIHWKVKIYHKVRDSVNYAQINDLQIDMCSLDWEK